MTLSEDRLTTSSPPSSSLNTINSSELHASSPAAPPSSLAWGITTAVYAALGFRVMRREDKRRSPRLRSRSPDYLTTGYHLKTVADVWRQSHRRRHISRRNRRTYRGGRRTVAGAAGTPLSACRLRTITRDRINGIGDLGRTRARQPPRRAGTKTKRA